jgi:signal transduction histidine kinase
LLSARPDFLSRFGHDLRAPLSSLNGVLRLLAADPAPPEALRGALARQALAASLQLQCQIDDAITLARLESAAEPPRCMPSICELCSIRCSPIWHRLRRP